MINILTNEEATHELQRKVDEEVFPEAFKSRWGYHICSYETFKKLKALHKEFWKAVQKRAEWLRWEAKQPQNRVRRPKIRNEKGQVIGYRPSEPWAEPKLSEVFHIPVSRIKGRNRVDLSRAHSLRKYYEEARKPAVTALGVKPFSESSLSLIDDYYQKLTAPKEEKVA